MAIIISEHRVYQRLAPIASTPWHHGGAGQRELARGSVLLGTSFLTLPTSVGLDQGPHRIVSADPRGWNQAGTRLGHQRLSNYLHIEDKHDISDKGRGRVRMVTGPTMPRAWSR